MAARSTVFCLPGEHENWLRTFAGNCKLQAWAFTYYTDLVEYKVGPPWLDIKGQIPDRIFFFPAESFHQVTSFKGIQPRIWGWIDVTPPRVLNQSPPVLLLAELCAEDRSDLSYKPSRLLAVYKRLISKEVTFGARGCNVITSGSGLSRVIGHTEGARKFLEEGGLWKSTRVTRIIFRPDSTAMRGSSGPENGPESGTGLIS